MKMSRASKLVVVIEDDPLVLEATEGLLRSWGGLSIKHSPKDMDVEVDNLLLPAPKRKGGKESRLREGMELVEWPLVRWRDGRSNMDLRFLKLN